MTANKNKQDLLDRLKRLFVSPIISTKGLLKVKKLYRQISKSETITVDMENTVKQYEKGKF